MSHISHNEGERSGHWWAILAGATCLGVLFALLWTTAAHGGLDVPREAIDWLTGRKPGSVSRFYDELLLALLTCAAIALLLLLANIRAVPGNSRRPPASKN
jgi:hypothetical protein